MPLRQIAVGLLLVALLVGPAPVTGGLHALGWLLVIGATQRLPRAEGRSGLTTAAVVALLVALPLAVPPVADRVAAADPSIAWVLSLPQVLVVWLLARHLVEAAVEDGDPDAASWWRWVRTGAIGTAVLPALAFPTGSAAAIGATVLVGVLTLLLAVVLLWWHAPRSWAGGPGRPGRPGVPRDPHPGPVVSPPDRDDAS